MEWTAAETGIVLAVVGGLTGLFLLLRWLEPRLIYFPNLPTRKVLRTPESLGMEYREVWLTTSDGVRLHGWHLPTPGARYTLLFCHGNAGNISHWLEKARFLQECGCSLFLFDYRGFGQSDGQTDEQGTYRDARAAYDYLTGPLALSPAEIVFWGESLGSGVVVELATQVPAAGLILEAAYTSVVDAGQRIYWFLQVRLILRNRYESVRKLPKIHQPLLIFHGRDDKLFPFHFAERLHAGANPPKRLVALRGGHTEGVVGQNKTVSKEAIQEFLESLPVKEPTIGAGN